MAERRFVVEGPQAVREALGAGGLLELFYEPGRQDELVAAARALGTPVTEVTAAVLAAMADTVTPQGLVGIAPLLDVDLDSVRQPRLVAVLEAVNDPGNAGTVIRTADAAGADAVVLTAGSVDPHNAKCVRATAGSLWHLPVVSDADLTAVVRRLQADGVQVLATSGAGSDDLDDLVIRGALAGATAWLFGPEAAGLSEEAMALADRVVRIPMRGRAESLNLSAAAAVCLFSSARAHRESYASGPIQP
ncbi:MAG: methyltransferase, TrmH family [Actinomycetota bacterium]|nr:methyltransferase, TrmH family [Actinomycetota bacterium]